MKDILNKLYGKESKELSLKQRTYLEVLLLYKTLSHFFSPAYNFVTTRENRSLVDVDRLTRRDISGKKETVEFKRVTSNWLPSKTRRCTYEISYGDEPAFIIHGYYDIPLLYLGLWYSVEELGAVYPHEKTSLANHPWVKKWCSWERLNEWLKLDGRVPEPKEEPGNIILLVGESGCGKSTIEKRLVNDYGLKPLKSYTTRDKRTPTEDTHIFIDKFIFEKGVDLAGGIDEFKEQTVAYTFFNGNHYYATQEQVEKADIYTIDPDGVEWFKTHYTGEKNAIVVYICTNEHVRYARMSCDRGEKSAQERITHDRAKFADAPRIADIVISNNGVGEDFIRSVAESIYDIYCKGGIDR